MLRLTFVQAFNVMRVFLSMYYDKTQLDHIGTLCGSLNLWKGSMDWKENPKTFDPRAWGEWVSCVEKTLNEMGIQGDSKKIFYDEELAFLCMKNYMHFFYNQVLWDDIKNFLNIIEQTSYVDSDLVWQEWIKAVNHTINGTYELDVYFDPFTDERMS